MLKVSVEEDHQGGLLHHSFEIDRQNESWIIDKEIFDGDIVQIRDNHFHVIWNHQSFNIEILESNPVTKTFIVLINGRTYSTSVRDQFDLLLERMGMHNKISQKINTLRAPMPGLIQSVAVKEGDRVKKGDILFVLVAMKMENIIKSPGEGTVKSLKIAAEETVEKNQVMLEFE